LSAKAWQPLIAVLIVLGVPAAAAAEWRHLVVRHPVAALALAVGWLVICGAGAAARLALSGPARRRLEQAGNAADRAAGWWISSYGRRYRQWVLDSRRYVDVKDFVTGGDHTPELDDVYVDVALVRRAPHQVSGDPLSRVSEDAAGRYSINEFLDRRERVVLAVTGPPGSGKSTLLAHTARRIARAGHSNSRRAPVLLALREQAAAIKTNPARVLADVVRSAVSGVPGKEPDGWWERQLRRGKCMILLDGLDEVADEKDRRAITDWVERQISSYPGNHFVITSRPYGLPGPVIAHADILAVRPFTAEQVQLFVNRWYLAAERHATGAVTKPQMRAARIRAGESAARLLTLLRANPALHDLTVNPLLLTLIATVHRYRGALPGSRADLYGEICQVMLSRRIQAKDLPELLPWPAKQKLLTALAYQMMLKRVSELLINQILEILDPLLSRMPQSVTGQAFLDDVSYNGLVVESAPGKYAFTHLTFQEYLSARNVSSDPRLSKTLADAVDDPWWRETILLYAATSDADQIVRACLDSATIPALSLAFECAEISSEIALELRQRLNHVREQAYQHDCDSRHRRLIAAVLAARLARDAITASTGTRICERLVPADLYWLFLQDTQSLEPDSPCEPEPDLPATGMWGSEAVAFLDWLNLVTAGSGQSEFRLLHEDELGDPAVIAVLASQFPDPVTGVWIRPAQDGKMLILWIPPGKPHPHLVTADMIRQAIVLDTIDTEVLVRILTVVAFSVAQDLARAPTLSKARTLSDILNRTRDLTSARVGTLAGASVSARARARERVRAQTSGRALDLARARDIDRNVNRARALDRALSRAIDRKLDLDRAMNLNEPDGDTRNLSLDLAHGLARALGFGPGRTVRLVGSSGIPAMWVSEGPLGRASQRAITVIAPSGETDRTFASELISNAGIDRMMEFVASLNGSLATQLRFMASQGPVSDHASDVWDPATWSDCLTEIDELIGSKRQRLNATEVAGIRAVTLALASESVGKDVPAATAFRTVAATVTLLQARQQGTAKIGESIILALA
jgi:NACHT domain